jgi:hypothetical protein
MNVEFTTFITFITFPTFPNSGPRHEWQGRKSKQSIKTANELVMQKGYSLLPLLHTFQNSL